MADSSLIDEKGRIKKGELLRNALKDAETLSEKVIFDSFKKYLKHKDNRNIEFLALNSRDINYMQIFKIETNDKEEIADYIIDFLKDSSFVTTTEDNVLVATNSIEHHSMIDIKDIEDEGNGLGLYIDGYYFRLYNAAWQIETIK